MIFSNREQAARLLADKLSAYKGQNPLVLAIPRGAVPMARIVAEALGGEFDVVLVRKLGAPGNPEFAIGAIDETGWATLGPYAALAGANADYIERAKARELETISKRRAQYSPLHPPIDPKGRVVIVVDDGLATGSTMLAALHALRQRAPQKLVCAVPVAPPDTLEKVGEQADEVVCLYAPENFQAVGQFYADFGQVEDEEVIALLSERKKP
jgi:predicted phosphoribosyltransferase